MKHQGGLLLALVLLVQSFVGVAHQSDSISVDDPRPLAKLADVLEGRYGWIITYEDPRYEHAADLADVTESVRRSSTSQSTSRVLIPRGGAFSYSFAPPPPRDAQKMATVLDGAISQYNAAGYPGRFRVTQGEQVFHVTPVSVQARDGNSIAQSSILDASVSIPAQKNRDGYQALSLLMTAVSSVNQRKVVVGTVPINLLVQSHLELGASSEPARSVLMKMLKATGRGLSWRLFYDPGLQYYVLNVHPVN